MSALSLAVGARLGVEPLEGVDVRRFPLRTLILMVLALIVFARMWIITHSKKDEEPGKPPPPRPGMKVDAGPPPEAPKAQMSVRLSTIRPRACSGLI